MRNQVDPEATVRADSHKIRQALLNILLNAVQSIEGAGSVTVASEVDDDVPLLIERSLEHFARENGRPRHTIDAGSCKRLQTYDWPGNVRELQNSI